MTRSAILLAAVSAALSWPAAGHAHDWYPYACCSGMDCYPVTRGVEVEATVDGWHIPASGETIPYGDARIRTTPPEQDGYHRCSVAGAPEGRTICLFIPHEGA